MARKWYLGSEYEMMFEMWIWNDWDMIKKCWFEIWFWYVELRYDHEMMFDDEIWKKKLWEAHVNKGVWKSMRWDLRNDVWACGIMYMERKCVV
jgi:hypothetical protein